eukprot:SAG22_NODE_2654_length_2333_cov_207.686213_4_plen_152_part_00
MALSFKGSDHCLSFCFSAFPCGSTALTYDTCCSQAQTRLAEHGQEVAMLRQLLEDEADKERHIPNRHGLRGECLSLWFLLPKALLPFFAAHCLSSWFIQCSDAAALRRRGLQHVQERGDAAARVQRHDLAAVPPRGDRAAGALSVCPELKT